MTQQSANNTLFDALMMGIQDQAFLLEASSMQLINASQSACQQLDCELPALLKQSLQTTLGVTQEALFAFVRSHQLIAKLALPNQTSNVRFFPLQHLNIAMVEMGGDQCKPPQTRLRNV